jgi:hypothetical protein
MLEKHPVAVKDITAVLPKHDHFIILWSFPVLNLSFRTWIGYQLDTYE